jgi:hypothetical protein
MDWDHAGFKLGLIQSKRATRRLCNAVANTLRTWVCDQFAIGANG